MNYNSLVLDLQHYMVRYDQPYINKIPDLIQQGIIRIYNKAKDLGFEIVTRHINIPAGTTVIDKPSNWLETVSIQTINPDTTDEVFLIPRSFEFCKTYWPYYSNPLKTAKPKYYADLANNLNNVNLQNTYGNMQWLITPTPDRIYNFTVIYLGIPLFNVDNQTNFLTKRYPSLLLSSCLIEAALFLDNQPKLAEYRNMFNEELDTINKINKDRSADRTIIRENN